MNDLADPSALTEPRPDVDLRALTAPPGLSTALRTGRRRSVVLAVAVSVLIAGLAGGGLWHRAVTANPGLELYGLNVYRDEASTDYTGIERKRNLLGEELDVAFVPGGRLYAHFGLYNGGAHDVRIEDPPVGRYYYWGFDRMSLSTDPDDGFVGVASRYEPFRPFTLHRGETREVRLEFHLADCDPASLQAGGYSSLDGLRLRYRTFGITRSHAVPFREAAIAVQAMGICEHPITD